MIRVCIITAMLLLLQACSDTQPASHYVQAELEAWIQYGNEAERRTIQQQVSHFNELQDAVRINAVILPPGDYRQQVDDAAVSGGLPDILELDSATVGYHAWHDQLQPIDKLLTDSIRIDLLPSLLTQNMLQGRLYAVSPNSRVMVLYARHSMLERAGVKVPGRMSAATFAGLIEGLAVNDHPVIELHHQRGEQWLAEALLPLVASGDAHVNELEDLATRLDAPLTLRLLEQMQGWFTHGVIDNSDDDVFLKGRVPLALASQAEFEAYHRAWKDDLLILPLGRNGLWADRSWGISRDCRDTRIAMRFIEFLLQADEILMMADASDTLPATRSALQMSSRYQVDGTRVFDSVLLEHGSSSHVASPAYPQLRRRFYRLLQSIAADAVVSDQTGRAVEDMRPIIASYQE